MGTRRQCDPCHAPDRPEIGIGRVASDAFDRSRTHPTTAAQYLGGNSTAWGITLSASHIVTFANASASGIAEQFQWAVHELAHAFENAIEREIGSKIGRDSIPDILLNRGERSGFAGGFQGWQLSTDIGRGEIFADMVVGWTYNQWEVSRLGIMRVSLMNNAMPWWLMVTMTP